MILPIYLYGTDELRAVAAEADLTKKEEISRLVADMDETMHHADGCGIAAPQVGQSLRILIVDGKDLTDVYDYLEGFKRVMINPVLLEESEEEAVFSEGCLSLPDIHLEVKRPARIKVRYYNENFKQVEEEFDRFACRMVQHEMDHLDGRVFVDRVPPIRRKMMQGRLNGIARGCVHTSYKTKSRKGKIR